MSVSLVIDYGSGASKAFSGLPHRHDMPVVEALDEAGKVSPGVSYEFDTHFVDRAAREVGRVVEIDGVKEENGKHWALSINGRAVPSEIRDPTDSRFIDRGMLALDDGDEVRFALVF